MGPADCSCVAHPGSLREAWVTYRLRTLIRGLNETMTSLLFYGDPHGEWRPLLETLQGHSPDAVVLLGDCDLHRALSDELGDGLPSPERLFFILGNHEADRQCFYDNVLSAAPSSNHLNAKVVEVGGVRIAGLSGTFDQHVWHPDLNDGEPFYRTRAEMLWHLRAKQRADTELPLRYKVAVWYEDYEALFAESCDVLVLHDAPPPHRYGHAVLDDLAEAMDARLIVHGHHHERYESKTYSGIRVLGLGKADPEWIRFSG